MLQQSVARKQCRNRRVRIAFACPKPQPQGSIIQNFLSECETESKTDLSFSPPPFSSPPDRTFAFSHPLFYINWHNVCAACVAGATPVACVICLGCGNLESVAICHVPCVHQPLRNSHLSCIAPHMPCAIYHLSHAVFRILYRAYHVSHYMFHVCILEAKYNILCAAPRSS